MYGSLIYSAYQLKISLEWPYAEGYLAKKNIL